MESTKRPPAPGRLRLVQQFVNSADLERPEREELSNQEAARIWFESRGLLEPGEAVSDEERRHAIEVREALRCLADVNAGVAMEGYAGDVLTRAADQSDFRLQFDPKGGTTLEPRARGVAGALGRLLAIVHESMEQGTWSRLKTCPADPCRWAFYDYSKNRSGTWCLMDACGNREKARAYRRRHAHAPVRRRTTAPATTDTPS